MAIDDNYTKSLLHFSGANGSTDIIDESGKIWTVSGNAKIDSTNSKINNTSCYFDGSGDYIDTPSHTDFNVGTGDWTLELFVYPDGSQSASYPSIWNNGTSWSAGTLNLEYDSVGYANKFILGANTLSQVVIGLNTYSNGNWYHVAVMRKGNILFIFVNGVLDGFSSISSSTTFDFSKNIFRLGSGSWDGANGYFKGWIDEFRFSSVARYNAITFTPTTKEFATTPKCYISNKVDRLNTKGVSIYNQLA